MSIKIPSDHRVIHRFTILREGWEMDNEGVVTEDKKGKRHLFGTGHGSPCAISIEELKEDYRLHIEATESIAEALRLMRESE